MKKAAYILFFLSSLIFIIANTFDYQIISNITKPIPLIILILLVSRNSSYNKWITLGLIFSLLGDILLMDSLDLFVFGLIAFLIAHIFYIFAFLNKNSRAELLSCIPFYLYGILFYWFLRNNLGEMAIPVSFYMLIITTMLWRSYVQKNKETLSKWAFGGAILFALSDSMIAVSKFYEPFIFSTFLIMLSYWAGQFMIFWSTNPTSVKSSDIV